MRCLAVCQDELVIRMLDQILAPTLDIDFLVESRALARRLHAARLPVVAGDIRRTDTYIKADVSPLTIVIIEDNGRNNLPRVIEAVRDAGGALLYVLGVGANDREQRAEAVRSTFPDVTYLSLAELFEAPLLTEFSRALTRARVQQYQRYLADADRILILLHNEPDPDAMASGLALRTVLHRTKATAVIAALEGVTRPENVRMGNLLDIQVETIRPAHIDDFERITMVDVQPHYFEGIIDRVDLVIDHHPEQHGYNAVFKDIRADYGSTCTIMTEHLRAVDVDISERTATAMLYAIKSDTLFFNRQANRVDIDAFSYLYPLADPALIRRVEGAEITTERLHFLMKAAERGRMVEQVFGAYIGKCPREDIIPYVADFFLQLENVRWVVIAGELNGTFVMSVRNLGYTRNAGDFVRRHFSDIGSAGGHRAMAKAIVPLDAIRARLGDLDEVQMTTKLIELVTEFRRETGPGEKKKEPIASH
jgi:nanoRNase/pAp phosphatase (c-di-AMP/oligoRNAs hydrolase)